MEKIQQFDREQIPPRNVHAVGSGAYGTFRVTNDISRYTKAAALQPGTTTPAFVRLSGVFTEKGEAQTVRDVRGLAVKMYSAEGNWDITCTNFPVFGARDAKLGPDVIHAFKRDPRTGDWFPTQTWDFLDKHPEGLHQALMLYTSWGTPLSYRHQHYWACNTYSLINAQNKRVWVKFHWISDKGGKGMNQEEAKMIAGEDPDWLSRDLRESIARGDFPRWKLCIQVMEEEAGYQWPWTFDPTKVWPHGQYPLIDVGVLELNRYPLDHFTEVEQAAFSPSNIVPGVGFSPDRLLQGRLMIYPDTQFHRLGPNFKLLPNNVPKGVNTPHNPYHALQGQGQLEPRMKFPHYYPSAFGKSEPDARHIEPPLKVDGPVGFYNPEKEGTDEDYYAQPRVFWTRVLNADEKAKVIDNISTSLSCVVDDGVVQRIINHLTKIDRSLGESVNRMWHDIRSGNAQLTEPEKVWLKLNGLLQDKSREGKHRGATAAYGHGQTSHVM